MPLALRQTAAFVLASLLALGFAPGCSQQAEGERCDKLKTGDADCGDGLVCVKKSELLDASADRCCPPGTSFGDQRCTQKGTEASSGGSTTGPAITPTAGTAADNVGGGGGAPPLPLDADAGEGPVSGGAPNEPAAGGASGSAQGGAG